MKVLFICTGNTCRSTMGEYLLNHLARERGLDWKARSCGIAAERYFKVPPGVLTSLKAEGISEVNHIPQLVGRELLAEADLALAMTEEHFDAVVDEYPEFRSKLHLLKTYAGLAGRQNIEDPIGQADDVYAACCREIKQAIEALLRPAPQAPPQEGKNERT